MKQLTEPQRKMLAILAARPTTANPAYAPVKALVKRGFATSNDDGGLSHPIYQITDAGRAYLAADDRCEKCNGSGYRCEGCGEGTEDCICGDDSMMETCEYCAGSGKQG